MLKSKPGIVYAELLAERDGDAYTYTVESEYGVDIRKNLFFSLAERGWAMVGLESLGMSLEDIFISVVDKSDELPSARERAQRGTKRGQSKAQKGESTSQVAAQLLKDAEQKREEEAKNYDFGSEFDD